MIMYVNVFRSVGICLEPSVTMLEVGIDGAILPTGDVDGAGLDGEGKIEVVREVEHLHNTEKDDTRYCMDGDCVLTNIICILYLYRPKNLFIESKLLASHLVGGIAGSDDGPDGDGEMGEVDPVDKTEKDGGYVPTVRENVRDTDISCIVCMYTGRRTWTSRHHQRPMLWPVWPDMTFLQAISTVSAPALAFKIFTAITKTGHMDLKFVDTKYLHFVWIGRWRQDM